jgi:hypothetical protein
LRCFFREPISYNRAKKSNYGKAPTFLWNFKGFIGGIRRITTKNAIEKAPLLHSRIVKQTEFVIKTR